MSLLDRARELEDISDAQLAQLVQQGSEAGDTWLAATETQRRKDMRDRYQAEQAKQQAANPPDIMTQRMGELGGGIPSADPNMGAPPDPSLQTGIAGPPPGMAGGGPIQRYQNGGEVGDPDPDDMAQRIQDLTYEKIVRESGESPERVYGTARLPPWRPGPVPALVQQLLASDPEYRAQYEADRAEGEASTSLVTAGGYAEEAEKLGMSLEDFASQTGLGGGYFRDYEQSQVEPYEWDNRRQLEELLAKGDIDQSAYDAGMADLLTGPAALDPVTGKRLNEDAYQKARKQRSWAVGDEEQGTDSIQAILDALQGGGPGRTQQDVWDEMSGRVGDFQASQRESPEDRAWDEKRRAATARELEMAGGIRSLDKERLTEQERLLAKGLGISEDRIAELMREMDTPEEVENRRKSAGYGALSSMFLNPSLAAGIGGMGERIRDTDDILRSERKTALTEIRAERQTGFDFEDLKRKGIFDLTKKSQTDYDTADIAVDNMEATILKAKADRGRAGELEAMKGYLDLLKSQASQIGLWNSTTAQIDAQMRSAQMDRDNPVAQANAWEKIEDALDDWRNRIDQSTPEGKEEYKLYERTVRMKDLGVGSLVLSGGVALAGQDGSDPRGLGTGGTDTYQTKSPGGSSSSSSSVRALIPS